MRHLRPTKLRADTSNRLIGMPNVRANRGPFSSEAEALAQVITTLVQGLDPEAIWLFGSRADGSNAPDSDFDLLVVTKTDSGDAGYDYGAVYAPIAGLGVGCDVVPCRADDFAEEMTDPTGLCWHIVRTGKKLYDRRAPDRSVLRSG